MGVPTQQPSGYPTTRSSNQPSTIPSVTPTIYPTDIPSQQPTRNPTRKPSCQPSLSPTRQPSACPSSPTVRPLPPRGWEDASEDDNSSLSSNSVGNAAGSDLNENDYMGTTGSENNEFRMPAPVVTTDSDEDPSVSPPPDSTNLAILGFWSFRTRLVFSYGIERGNERDISVTAPADVRFSTQSYDSNVQISGDEYEGEDEEEGGGGGDEEEGGGGGDEEEVQVGGRSGVNVTEEFSDERGQLLRISSQNSAYLVEDRSRDDANSGIGRVSEEYESYRLPEDAYERRYVEEYHTGSDAPISFDGVVLVPEQRVESSSAAENTKVSVIASDNEAIYIVMFKAVFIPADATAIIEERILDASGGLENDRLRLEAEAYFSVTTKQEREDIEKHSLAQIDDALKQQSADSTINPNLLQNLSKQSSLEIVSLSLPRS
eukprot:gene34460-44527_t